MNIPLAFDETFTSHHDVIVELAKQKQADIILMGSHGHGRRSDRWSLAPWYLASLRERRGEC
jgi:hypothetical protein